ncbi:hypothetical protein CKA32_003518 [Geitlerinema sp. FC II]|nr:hypothetical protein CKA32_003518 [Geitlerinema sp. FC II]
MREKFFGWVWEKMAFRLNVFCTKFYFSDNFTSFFDVDEYNSKISILFVKSIFQKN